MKFHRLTFLASVCLTAFMLVLVLVFDKAEQNFSGTDTGFYLLVAGSFLAMLGLNYLALEFLFNFYGKKQIRKISTILPEDFTENADDLDFARLGQRVSDLSEKNTMTLDTMQAMEAYRKEYMGNISHEMKTPLFSIQGYVATLMEGGVENLAIRDKYLERIDRSVQRLLHIVKDLDMINQFESGRINLSVSTFDINALLREIADLLDLEAERKNTRLQLKVSAGSLLVSADKQKIAQVLINLVSNAIYYANRDFATVTLHTEIVGNKALIEVKDNGMGMKPETVSRIFERFFRVETSRNRHDGGSGLGLAIVKHILEAHQESIFVESTYLEGSRFWFMLPLAAV